MLYRLDLTTRDTIKTFVWFNYNIFCIYNPRRKIVSKKNQKKKHYEIYMIK